MSDVIETFLTRLSGWGFQFASLSEAKRIQYQREKDFKNAVEMLRDANEAIRNAQNELGVPQPGYPAPVANACDFLSQWRAKWEKELGEK